MGSVTPIDIEKEVRTSYLDYAMSVIVARALPDVRDGLKPVQRRILYGMWRLNLKHGTKFAKSARIVGAIMGYYHPHGDAPIYEALVRMAQNFSLRYPLITGQGNFGCFTGDTKVRLIDGRALSFIELIREAKEGKKHYTYTYHHETKEVSIAQIQNPRKTQINAKLVRVVLDNGKEIRCTPNHRFMLRSGGYKEAKDLRTGDSLMPLYTRLSTKEDDTNIVDYEMVYQPTHGMWDYTHRLSDEWNLARGVYARATGKVRHHVDFNKRNNNPENIRRLKWEDHWRIHYEFTATRHKIDPEYRRKLAQGRSTYFALPETKQKIAQRMSERNKKMWKEPDYRANKINAIKEKWNNLEYKNYMAHLASERLMKKWQEEWFRKIIGKKKSLEMKQRWQNPEYRAFWKQRTREISQKIWENPMHRAYLSKIMKARWQDKAYRKERSSVAKALWRNSTYRSKFSKEHFIRAARKLWEDEGWQLYHREQMKQRWTNREFREKVRKGVERASRERIQKNPHYMRSLTDKAKAALHTKWQSQAYKKAVIRSKILGFVAKLLSQNEIVTPDLYEQKRTNNGIPRIDKALQYFSDFQDMVERAKYYNHKVVAVEFLSRREDVYDLTIERTHNFALADGIFVHNSIDGDAPAQLRYTEAKLALIAEEILEEIDKDTVTWRETFDGSRKEPEFLPSKIPQLLLNGAQGIAVGMATYIPPHNLSELIDALVYLLFHPNAQVDQLLQFIKGPDFPTAGIIYDSQAIKTVYATGRGAIPTRARIEIQEEKKGKYIVVSELPYQVNKADLITEIADLVRAGKLEGIQDIIDGSRKNSINIVIELKRGAAPQHVLNKLYHHTRLQKNINVLMIGLVDGIEPRLLSLPELLQLFLAHRHQTITKRTEFELAQAKKRLHILEGLELALAHIDDVIALIKKSKHRDQAKESLQKEFRLSDVQAEAILQIRLQTLAALERQAILDELKEKKALVKELESILASPQRIRDLIKKEFLDIKKRFGDERKTEVVEKPLSGFEATDLIPQERVLIMMTKNGYIKRVSPKAFNVQGRGGVGVSGIELQEGDVVEKSLGAWTHDDILFFSTNGKLFATKTYNISEKTRIAKGEGLYEFFDSQNPIADIHALSQEMRDQKNASLVALSRKGQIKKISLATITRIPRKGIKIMNVVGDDAGLALLVAPSSTPLFACTAGGQALKFSLKEIRPMGRQASGVRGMRLKKEDELIKLLPLTNPDNILLLITENGYGKKVKASSFALHHRGTSGIKTLTVTQKTGRLAHAVVLPPSVDSLLIYSLKGKVLKIHTKNIPLLGRTAQGVRLIRLKGGDKVASALLL